MKTCFEKYASYIAKSANRIYLHRSGDVVYVCDGFSMVKIPYITYLTDYCSVSPIFIDLKDGDKASWDSKDYNPFAQLNADIPAGEEIWNKEFNNSTVGARISPFSLDLDYKKKLKGRFITCDNGEYIIINEKYYQCFAGYKYQAKSCGNRLSPVFFLTENASGEFFGFMVLPMRYKPEILTDFLTVAKLKENEKSES